MPTDSLLVVTAVCFAFLLFAIVVAWVDHTTSQWLRARSTQKRAPSGHAPPHKSAA